jgi:hypothetical protein
MAVLVDDVGIAFAAFRPGVARGHSAPPIRTEIAFRFDERTRIEHDVEDALIERFGRDRLGQKLGDAGIACRHDAPLLRMAGQHDDGHVRIGVGARLPDHLRQLEPVEDRHRPVGDDDIRDVMHERLQPGGAVLGLIDFARAEPIEQRPQDAAHMRVVLDDEETQSIEIDTDHSGGNAGDREHTSGAPWLQIRVNVRLSCALTACLPVRSRA